VERIRRYAEFPSEHEIVRGLKVPILQKPACGRMHGHPVR